MLLACMSIIKPVPWMVFLVMCSTARTIPCVKDMALFLGARSVESLSMCMREVSVGVNLN